MSGQPQAELPSEISIISHAHNPGQLNRLIAANDLFFRTSIGGTTSSYNDTKVSSIPSIPDLSTLKLGVSGRLSLNEFLSRGSLGSVYRGAFEGAHEAAGASSTTSVIIKLVVEEDNLALLSHEASIYQRATRLQGSVLPHNYGFYENEKQTVAFILLEDCGLPYGKSFEDLSDATKLTLMQALKQLHDSGIQHGDLQPWNVLNYNGSLRIVGLHLAIIHPCPAKAQVMTEEFCSHEGISELECEELVSVGGRMMFRSQNQISYG
ncbi:hypothetical protein JB92DRAFT_3145374 [Gautieria morchelliformis]|nr:hypothetical protein JB92DRAFT_3145374 [Gautieria morchelliformis]